MKLSYESERLSMKVLTSSDAELVLDFYQRNKDFHQPYDPIKPPEFFNLAFQQEVLQIELQEAIKGKMLRLYFFDKKRPRRIIGMVNFGNIIRGAFQSCFVGYKMDKDALLQGYMTEALKRGVEIIFDQVKLHRIEANIMPRNEASIATAKKAGFHYEGLSKKYLKINGQWEDHVHYVILNEVMEE